MIMWLNQNKQKFRSIIDQQFFINSQIPIQKKKNVDSSESQDQEKFTELKFQPKKKTFKMRQSVCAQVSLFYKVIGKFNKQKQFIPKIIQKTQQQKQRIKFIVLKSFIFNNLDAKSLQIILDAIQQEKIGPNQYVIREGQDGQVLYIVEEGQLECTKVLHPGQNPTVLKHYVPGQTFGQLALLYNCPRQATIKSITQSILWVILNQKSLDRQTFNHIVRDAAKKRRQRYNSFLQSVQLLNKMDPYERNKIADVLKSITFKQGQYVVKEGQKGNTFYIVEEGELAAIKIIDQKEKQVMQYSAGNYFGQIALINDVPRQASILCKKQCKLVYLERDAFKRLLGPVDNILKRKLKEYQGLKV